MKITEYMFKLYIGMTTTAPQELKQAYYMEYQATLHLLTNFEIGELRRKIFKYKGWF